MSGRLFLAVLLAAAAFLAYSVFNSYRSKEAFEVFAPAPPIYQPIPEPPRTVAPAGPSPPNQSPPDEMPPVRLPAPGDSDPYGEDYGSSDIQDNMRYPERLFGPAPKPNNTSLAVGADVASFHEATVSQAIQTFKPELAQNGGEFMDGIFANDTNTDPNFSAY